MAIASCASCQSYQLSGQITDKETGEGLPYATVELFSQHIGTSADQYGNFQLDISSKEIQQDSLEFSHLGYKKLKLTVHDFNNLKNKIISLVASPIILSEIKITPKAYEYLTFGITDKKPTREQYANIFNSCLGNFIDNTKHVNGIFKSVSFYISKEGYPETPFRIRIFELDVINNCPGKDLLQENIIVSANKSGWFTVDLTKYNIPFPSNGAYVMMEWINSGNKYFFNKEFKIKGTNGVPDQVIKKRFYGQAIGTVNKKPQKVMWAKGLGNNWVSHDFFFKGYINAMINAKFAFPIN